MNRCIIAFASLLFVSGASADPNAEGARQREAGLAAQAAGKLSDAAALFTAACDAGDGKACGRLSAMVRYGEGGLQKDDDASLALAQKGCDLNDGDSCGQIGYAYANGSYGLAKDEDRAAPLLRKGCALDSAFTCFHYALVWRNGVGVPMDAAETTALFEKSCALGNGDACLQLDPVALAAIRESVEAMKKIDAELAARRASEDAFFGARSAAGTNACQAAYDRAVDLNNQYASTANAYLADAERYTAKARGDPFSASGMLANDALVKHSRIVTNVCLGAATQARIAMDAGCPASVVREIIGIGRAAYSTRTASSLVALDETFRGTQSCNAELDRLESP